MRQISIRNRSVTAWAIVRARIVASALFVALTATRAGADGGTAAGGVAGGTQPWSGYYLGGHLGYAGGASNWTAQAPSEIVQGSFEFARPYDVFKGTGSYFGGLQAGYNYRLPAGVVLGVEADLLAPNTFKDTRTLSSPAIGQASLSEKVEMSGTVRARLGIVQHDWLFYAMAGYAWSSDQFVRTQLLGTPLGGTAVPGAFEKAGAWRNGWALGTGVEVAVASKWTASFEYLYTGFGAQSVSFPAGAQQLASELTMQSVRVGLNYQFGDQDWKNGGPIGPSPPNSDNWSVHAQTTFTQQYAFPFHAPYRGPNSLDPAAGRETWDATFYLGARLWSGAELWVNPEIDQGFGLSGTVGVAGFPSGEAYKQGANDPCLSP
jgi:high affinity Mn2+ porin